MYSDTTCELYENMVKGLNCALYISAGGLEYADEIMKKLGNLHENMDAKKLSEYLDNI